jgi:hypothetical protein
MNLPAWIKPVGALIATGGALVAAFYYMYARPMGRISSELNTVIATNNELNAAIKDRPRVRQALKDFGATTIAATVDGADARFRSLLSEIAVTSGLSKSSVQINTSRPERVLNPGGTSKLTTRLKDDLKKQMDFLALNGTITGTGSLEASLRTLATLRAQPWVHRIESFSLKPEDKDRQRFALTVELVTLIAPDLAPANLPEPAIIPVPDGGRSTWAGIVQKNVFREPPPVVVATQPSTPPPATPVRPPWSDWKLTGLVESRLGTEVFLINTRDGQRLTLAVGSAVSEARFLGGQGERAYFEIGGERFEVFNGQTLEQRRPADR